MSRNIIPEIPYEKAIRNLMGNQWRSLPDRDRDGAWGIAIAKSISNGVKPDLYEIALHLGVDVDMIRTAFGRMSMNGALLRDRIHKDHDLANDDSLALGYYAGYASGYCGPLRDAKSTT